MNYNDLPTKFHRWESLWSDWKLYHEVNKVQPLSTCLNFVLSHETIDKIVIGVNSYSQIVEICDCINAQNDCPNFNFQINDMMLLNPFNWVKL